MHRVTIGATSTHAGYIGVFFGSLNTKTWGHNFAPWPTTPHALPYLFLSLQLRKLNSLIKITVYKTMQKYTSL